MQCGPRAACAVGGTQPPGSWLRPPPSLSLQPVAPRARPFRVLARARTISRRGHWLLESGDWLSLTSLKCPPGNGRGGRGAGETREPRGGKRDPAPGGQRVGRGLRGPALPESPQRGFLSPLGHGGPPAACAPRTSLLSRLGPRGAATRSPPPSGTGPGQLRGRAGEALPAGRVSFLLSEPYPSLRGLAPTAGAGLSVSACALRFQLISLRGRFVLVVVVTRRALSLLPNCESSGAQSLGPSS